MPVIAACRRCLTRSQFATDLAGHKVRCPVCGKRMRLPALMSFPAVPPPGVVADDPLGVLTRLRQFRKRLLSNQAAAEPAEVARPEPKTDEIDRPDPLEA